jgi:hypothetical protein
MEAAAADNDDDDENNGISNGPCIHLLHFSQT